MTLGASIAECRSFATDPDSSLDQLLRCSRLALTTRDHDLSAEIGRALLDRVVANQDQALDLVSRAVECWAGPLKSLPEAVTGVGELAASVDATVRTLRDAIPPELEVLRRRLRSLAIVASGDTIYDFASLCALLRALGRPDLGLDAADQGLELRPPDQRLLNTRGGALTDLGRLDEAVASFKKSLALGPSSYAANGLSRAFFLADELIESERWIRESLGLVPKGWGPAFALKRIATATGDLDLMDEANALIRQLEGPVSDAELSIWLRVKEVEWLIEVGLYEEARDSLEAIPEWRSYSPARRAFDRLTARGNRCWVGGCASQRVRGHAFCSAHRGGSSPQT